MGKITLNESCVLVGMFMREWAFVEIATNRVIAGSLGLSNTQSLIISKDLRFRVKYTLLRSMINSLPKKDDDRGEFKRVLKELDSLAKDRNVVAHDMFYPSSDGTKVDFYEVSIADTKPQYVLARSWTTRDFLDRVRKMHDLATSMEELRGKLKQVDSVIRLAELLSGAQPNILTKEFNTSENESQSTADILTSESAD